MTARTTFPDRLEDEIRSALAGYDLPAEPRRFVQMVMAALKSVVAARPTADAAAQLTRRELDELRGIGLDAAASSGAYPRALERSAAKMTAILTATQTVPQAAGRLGVTAGRVRQMLGDERALFGIKERGEWRIPSFQFEGDRLVRNLRAVVAALPGTLHPIEFFTWFTSPDPALQLDGRPLSPREWLETGGDPEAVAAEAAQL